jgi:hypothetical protein
MKTTLLSMLCGAALAVGLALGGCNTPEPKPVTAGPLVMTNGAVIHLDIVQGRAQ